MRLKKIILIFILMIFPLGVSANSLECPKVAVSNSEILCNFKLENAIGINANYNFGEGFTVLDFVPSGNWKTYYEDKTGFVVGNIKDSSNISASIKLKVSSNLEFNKDYTLTVTNISTTDSKGNLYNVGDIKTSIKVVSNDSYLKDLSLSNISFTEEFRKDRYIYYAETLNDKTVISASVLDTSSKLSGDIGEVSLDYGVNLFVVKVTSFYNFIREYKIYITRNYDENAKDSTLKSITLSSGEIDFNKDKFLYEISVENEVDNIDIEAISNSSMASIDIVKPDKLIVGENEIVITVTALDKTQSKYVLLITRKEKLNLDDTKVDDDKIDSKKDNTKSKIILFIVTFILVILLTFILVKVIQKLIKFIKNNKE